MQFSPETPRGKYKFAGVDLTAPHVLTAGHTLTDAEASAFNRFIVSYLGNSFGGWVRRSIEAANAERTEQAKKGEYTGPTVVVGQNKKGEDIIAPAPVTLADFDTDFQAKFDEMFAEYVIGESNRGGGGESLDPVEKIVRQLATAKVKELLKAKGKKINEVMAAKKDDGGSVFLSIVDQYVERHSDVLRAQAQAQLDALASIGADDEEGLFEGL